MITDDGMTSLSMPDLTLFPIAHRDAVTDLFQTWQKVRSRNTRLTTYYRMKNRLKDLGISIPPQLKNISSVVGWCAKAVNVRVVRSNFESFVFAGKTDPELDTIVRENRLTSKYTEAFCSSLVHGVSMLSVMRGKEGQPKVKIRAYSANQAAVLWDKDAERVACGVCLSDTDRKNNALRYIFHFPDTVMTASRATADDTWHLEIEENPLGRPFVELLVHEPDLDRPLGHSLLTPELLSIVDKAIRDVVRMEVGAEFFTAPQRYLLGADENIFKNDADKWRAYLGSIMAISKDELGETPSVGQFPAAEASNFTKVFENDAQRFSGATNVPLAQLGVLANTYTSSDALGAANDPLILDVEQANRRNAAALEEIARITMAICDETTLDALPDEKNAVQAYFSDPSKPTISARADAWTKLASVDTTIVGTRIFYEGFGFSQATINRLLAERKPMASIIELNRIADAADASAEAAMIAAGRKAAEEDTHDMT